METISDFSAAPHLPPSLRTHVSAPRPELVLKALAHSVQSGMKVNIYEYKGEIYIDLADAA